MNVIEHLRELHSRSTAVKEALDSLPSAVCYFTPNGSIKLCNAAMYRVYRSIAGRDLQCFAELKAALDSCGQDTPVTRDRNIFLFPDGRALQYSAKEIRTEDERLYTEAVLSDVTELYEKRKELERQSAELKQMFAELKTLSGQLLEVTREQEILNMKTLLHDQMNLGISAIRQVLRQNDTSGEEAAAIARFRRAIQILQEENTCPQNELNEFLRDAQVAGVQVNIRGELPAEEEPLRLLVAVMREACINAALHADATVLNIASELTESLVTLQITNDGRPPEAEVVPRGGLTELKKKIEKAGGAMEIRSLPAFGLKISLPAVRQDSTGEGAQQ